MADADRLAGIDARAPGIPDTVLASYLSARYITMKCDMACTKKAKLKISLSGSGTSMHLCYRHAFMYVKTQMQRLGDYDFGIFVQRPPSADQISHERARIARIQREREAQVETVPPSPLKDTGDWNF